MHNSMGKDYRQNILSFLASATPPGTAPAKEPAAPPVPEPDEDDNDEQDDLRIFSNEQYSD